MKKRWIIIIIIFAVFFAAIYGLSKKSRRGIEVKTEKAEVGDLTSYYSTTGTLESVNRKEYYSSGNSKITNIYVKVGDTVKKGDLLMEFETEDTSLQLKTAQIQYDNAVIQLNELKKQKNNLPKSQSSNNALSGTGASISSGSSHSTGAQVNSNGSQSTGISTAGSIDDQIKMQENQVELARLNIQSIKDSINKQQKYIKSDINGVVTSINGTVGGYASPQMQSPLIVVEDTSNLQVELNVNQYDVSSLKVGQDVTASFNGTETEGQVYSIAPTAVKTVSQSGTDTVTKVVVKLDNTSSILRIGYDVDISVKTGEKNNVLKVPAEAIITDKEDKDKVYINDNGVARLKEIKTGMQSDTEVEVVEGIKANDMVILNPPSALSDGAKVYEKSVAK
jgi:HlyD family secretion protein